MAKQTYYQAGVCNINEPETSYRRNVGHFFAATTALLFIGLVAFGVTPVVSVVLLFFPLWLGALNYLQARNKFCVMYAAQGVYNNSAEYAKTKAVSKKQDKQKDKSKANTMHLQAIVIAVAGSIGLTFLASLI